MAETTIAETFAGKVAVITGASAGIGSGYARQAASAGMRLVLADIAQARLDALAEELRADGTEVEAVVTDVADQASVDALAARAYSRFGCVDMLMNNAGIMAMGWSWEIPAERWDAALRINIGGYVNGLRAFVPRMLDAGTEGWIVQTSSIGGLYPSPLMAPYSVTKFGTLALTESLHYELRMRKAPIQVSVVLPDSVKSDIFTTALSGSTLPEAVAFNEALEHKAEADGITPEEHARRVFEQVAAGRYWITPQPDAVVGGVVPRAEMIRDHVTPVLDLGL